MLSEVRIVVTFISNFCHLQNFAAQYDPSKAADFGPGPMASI